MPEAAAEEDALPPDAAALLEALLLPAAAEEEEEDDGLAGAVGVDAARPELSTSAWCISHYHGHNQFSSISTESNGQSMLRISVSPVWLERSAEPCQTG